MSNIEKNAALQNAAEQFIGELKKLEESVASESDLENYMERYIVPLLTKDNQLCGTSVWSKLHIAVFLSESVLQRRCRSLEESLMYMNNSDICWLLDHVYNIQQLLNTSVACKYDQDNEYLKAVKSLNEDKKQLQGWLNGDLYERIQEYESEIKKLGGIES